MKKQLGQGAPPAFALAGGVAGVISTTKTFAQPAASKRYQEAPAI